jgi:hypothetical protein
VAATRAQAARCRQWWLLERTRAPTDRVEIIV